MADPTFSELVTEGNRLLKAGQDASAHYTAAVSAVRILAARGMIDEALKTQIYVYNELVKPIECEQAVREYFDETAPHLEAVASKLLPASGPNICFVLASGNLLGHAEVMLTTIAKAGREGVFVAALGKIDFEDEARIKESGASFIECGSRYKSYVHRIEYLHRELQRNGCGTVVWVSGGCLVHYAFARRIAETQIYWGMRYHGVVSKNIDGYISAWGNRSEKTKYIDGHAWSIAAIPFPDPKPRADEKAVADFSARMGSAFAFGTVAREEKLTDPYLDTVSDILDQCPNADFAYTGAKDHPGIVGHFQRRGQLQRIVCMGWVKVEAAIPALSCFLETFPLGGVTTAAAMDYGVPAVFLKSTMGVCSMHDDGFASKSLDDYVRKAVNCYSDKTYRDSLVAAQSAYIAHQHEMATADAQQLFALVDSMRERKAA